MIAFLIFIKTNLKWVAILAALFVFSFVGWKTYNLINDNAEQRAKIVELQNDIKLKDLALELTQKNFEMSQEVVASRDKIIEDLEEKSKDLMLELPVDQSDLAPESTRIFLERLKGVTQ